MMGKVRSRDMDSSERDRQTETEEKKQRGKKEKTERVRERRWGDMVGWYPFLGFFGVCLLGVLSYHVHVLASERTNPALVLLFS